MEKRNIHLPREIRDLRDKKGEEKERSMRIYRSERKG